MSKSNANLDLRIHDLVAKEAHRGAAYESIVSKQDTSHDASKSSSHRKQSENTKSTRRLPSERDRWIAESPS